MATEHEKALTRAMAALLAGGPAAQEPAQAGRYAWRLLRWAAACFAADGDVMTIMLALTRFPARVHRDTVLWLCAHTLMEHASVNLEQDGTMFIGEEFETAGEWLAHLAPMREISQWWRVVSPIGGALAHTHRTHLQTSIKRRQYASLGGYVSRVLRTETELSRVCFGFIPLVIEAVWSQHAEASLQSLTGKLK